MEKKLLSLIERLRQGTSEDLPEVTLWLAMILEYYSVNPAVRSSRRSELAKIVPEELLDLEVTDGELSELIRAIVVDGPAVLDLGVCFWMLGKSKQALGAAAAIRLLEARGYSLNEDQAAQAANSLSRLLVQRDSALEPQVRSEWFREVIQQWLASESEELKRTAKVLQKRLARTWSW